MRNIVLKGVLFTLIMLFSTTFSFSDDRFESGSGELAIIAQKTENVLISFNLPDIYIRKDGTITDVLNLRIVKEGETIIDMDVQSTTIVLPEINWKKGLYLVEITIGKHYDKITINI